MSIRNHEIFGIESVAFYRSGAGVAPIVLSHASTLELTSSPEQVDSMNAAGSLTAVFTRGQSVSGSVNFTSCPVNLAQLLYNYDVKQIGATTAFSSVITATGGGIASDATITDPTGDMGSAGTYLLHWDGGSIYLKRYSNDGGFETEDLGNGTVVTATSTLTVATPSGSVTISGLDGAPSSQADGSYIVFTIIPLLNSGGSYVHDSRKARPAVMIQARTNSVNDYGVAKQIVIPQAVGGEMSEGFGASDLKEASFSFKALWCADIEGEYTVLQGQAAN